MNVTADLSHSLGDPLSLELAQNTLKGERKTCETDMEGGRTNGKNNVGKEACSREPSPDPAMLGPLGEPRQKTQLQAKARLVETHLKSAHHSLAQLGQAPVRPQEFQPTSKESWPGALGVEGGVSPWKGGRQG